MSLIFKPRISFSFGSGRSSTVKNKTVHREEVVWSDADIEKLVVLRAMRCTYRECGTSFSRSAPACSNVVQTKDLYRAINKKRAEIMANVTK